MARLFLTRKWSYYLGEQRPINQIFDGHTCETTQQYMQVQLSENTKFKLVLWNDSGFSSPATAQCDYTVSGTAYGNSGTTYTGSEIILQDQHQHQFNLADVLQPGEIVSSFVVYSVNTSGCTCPVNVDFSPYVPPTPTPTPTNTPSPTPTPTPSPVPSYYSVFECNDPFGPSFVVKYYGTISVGESVKIIGDPVTCYEVSSTASAPEDYEVSDVFGDCTECQTS